MLEKIGFAFFFAVLALIVLLLCGFGSVIVALVQKFL